MAHLGEACSELLCSPMGSVGRGEAWLFVFLCGIQPHMQIPFPSLLSSVGTRGGYSAVLAAGSLRVPGTRAEGPDV